MGNEPTDKTSPRPWKVEDRRDAPLRNIRILGAHAVDIAWLSQVHTRDKMLYKRKDHSQGWTDEEANAADAGACANAKLIVRAVNAHDQLVAALNAITMIAGNLPDETLESCGGINEGRGRALMALSARTIARKALAALASSERTEEQTK